MLCIFCFVLVTIHACAFLTLLCIFFFMCVCPFGAGHILSFIMKLYPVFKKKKKRKQKKKIQKNKKTKNNFVNIFGLDI